MAGSNVIYDVDSASDVKNFIMTNKDVHFKDIDLKNKILTADPKSLLSVGVTINSPITIVSVDVVDSAFLAKNVKV